MGLAPKTDSLCGKAISILQDRTAIRSGTEMGLLSLFDLEFSQLGANH